MELDYSQTKILSEVKSSLGISSNEYCIIDIVSKFGSVATVSNMSETLGLSKGAVSNIVNSLISRGYLSRFLFSDQASLNQIIKHGGPYNSGCYACGFNRYIHRHHYPVRQKDGGTQTIPLCQDCHSEFHQYADHGVLSSNIQL
jgi:hypothetical protein